MKNKTLLEPSKLLLLLLVLMLGGIFTFVFLQIRTDKVKNTLDSEQNLAIAIVISSKDEQGKTVPRFNEVLVFNPVSKKTALIDVATNTGSLINSLGRVDGLSVLYKPQDMKSYLNKLEEFLGIPVPFYLIIPDDQIVRQVDLLAGIDLFVPSAIEKGQIDPMVLVPSGNSLMDGAKASLYVLHDEEGEDNADRINRHQRFIQSWFRKMGENKNYLLRSEVFPFLYQGIQTNMEDVGVKTLLGAAAVADWERIIFQRILGVERFVDKQKLLFPHYNGTLLKETVRQILEGLASKDVDKSAFGNVSIEISNGTKLPGLATRTTQLFKSFGYDVVASKNSDNSVLENTTLIDRHGNPDQAKKIADIIKCKKITAPPASENSEGGADITIILGKDFDGRYVR